MRHALHVITFPPSRFLHGRLSVCRTQCVNDEAHVGYTSAHTFDVIRL